MAIDISTLSAEQQAQLLTDLQAKAKEIEQVQLDELQDLFAALYDAALGFKSEVENKFPDVTTNSNINPELYTQYAGAVNIIANETARKNQLISQTMPIDINE